MAPARMTRRQWYVFAGGAAVAVILAGVVAFMLSGLGGPAYTPPSLPVLSPVAAPSASAAPSQSPAAVPALAVYARSAPVQLSIPAISVSARVEPVYDPGGVLQTPPLTVRNLTGWWAGSGPGNPAQSYSPGQQGPAVIVGHIDSAAAGPLVFWNLGKLHTGDKAEVTLASGQHVWFAVYALQEVPKTAFPTARVYGPTKVPELRLITCGGGFDSATGHYLDNLIVYLREIPAP